MGELSTAPTLACGLTITQVTPQPGVAEEAGDTLDMQQGLGLYSAIINFAKISCSLNLSCS